MKKLKKNLKKVVTNDLFYGLIFFSLYLYFFLDYRSAVFFSFSYLLIIFLTKLRRFLTRHFIFYGFLSGSLLFLGNYYYGTFQLVGFLIGSAIAGYMLLNYLVIKKENSVKKIVEESFRIGFITLLTQISFSFFYFYNIIIQDIRGQNKLNQTEVFYYIIAFVICVWSIQYLYKYILKKLDYVSFINIVFLTILALSFAFLYPTFLEIGTLNVIIPLALGVLVPLLLTISVYIGQTKKFKFKKTITSLIYVILPLILLLFYPWNISKYLGIIFMTLGLFLVSPYMMKVKDFEIELNLRKLNTYIFITNTYLFLSVLVSLSSAGLITKLNIANIDYLLMLIGGIFFVFLIKDLGYSIKHYLNKFNLIGTFSVIAIAASAFFTFLVLDMGRVESLGSFIFGLLTFVFVRNSFILRDANIQKKETEVSYTYLLNNLLNLITVLSIALMLVKI